jgi:DNA-directed RNA polymerase specialized sigma24 family protein
MQNIAVLTLQDTFEKHDTPTLPHDEVISMEDNALLTLYADRDESAIAETSAKFGAYCRKVAMNVLHNAEDADECVNDTWLKAWNAIPPEKPKVMSAFLGRITRNTALDVYEKRSAKKRGGSEFALVLDELEECIKASTNVQAEVEQKEVSCGDTGTARKSRPSRNKRSSAKARLKCACCGLARS